MTREEIDALVAYIDALEAEIVDIDVQNDDLQPRLDYARAVGSSPKEPPRVRKEAEYYLPDGVTPRQLNNSGHRLRTRDEMQATERRR